MVDVPQVDPAHDEGPVVALLRTTLDSIADGILVLDANFRIATYNRKLLEMWHVPEELMQSGDESIPRNFVLDQLTDPDAFLRAIEQLKQQPDLEATDVLTLKDGRIIERHAIPRRVGGKLQGRVLCFRDITERKKAEAALRQSEEQYRLLFQDNPHPMWIVDPSSRKILAVNSCAVLHYGYSSDEFAALQESDLQAGGIDEQQPESSPYFRTRHRKKDGTIIHVELTIHPIRFRNQQAELILAVDITESIVAQDTLNLLIEVTSTASEAEDTYTMTSRCLETICRMRGWELGQAWFPNEKDGFLFCSPHSYYSKMNVEEFRARSLALRFTKDIGLPGRVWSSMKPMWLEEISSEQNFPRAPQALRYDLTSAFCFPIQDHGRLLAIFEFFSTAIRPPTPHFLQAFERLGIHLGVVFQRKKEQETIRHQAYHDQLTGLPNRVLFRDRFEQALARRNRRDPGLMAMLFLDLDRFKTINDSLGHPIGDQLLQEVAGRLVRSLREIDTIARMGGDEFLILLPDLRLAEDAARVAEKILSVFDEPFHLENHDLHVTTSIGISIYPNDGKDAPTLMKNSDIALYRAKERGRNNYQLFTQSMTAAAIARLNLENGLRKSLERGEMTLYYQPILALPSGSLFSVEALLRWQHPEMGLLSPGQFISIAEESGLIMPIWAWALRAACRQNRAWQMLGVPAVPISMNISAAQFQQPNFVAIVRETLQESKLDPVHLELEITEGMAMRAEFAIKVLQELREMGARISLDDFGIGYSSLSYVKRFPLNTIKIDPHFLTELETDSADLAIVKTIIALGHGLKRSVIAEGVEKAEQFAILKALGCDGVQGYYICRPEPPETLTPRLLKGITLPG